MRSGGVVHHHDIMNITLANQTLNNSIMEMGIHGVYEKDASTDLTSYDQLTVSWNASCCYAIPVPSSHAIRTEHTVEFD